MYPYDFGSRFSKNQPSLGRHVEFSLDLFYPHLGAASQSAMTSKNCCWLLWCYKMGPKTSCKWSYNPKKVALDIGLSSYCNRGQISPHLQYNWFLGPFLCRMQSIRCFFGLRIALVSWQVDGSGESPPNFPDWRPRIPGNTCQTKSFVVLLPAHNFWLEKKKVFGCEEWRKIALERLLGLILSSEPPGRTIGV